MSSINGRRCHSWSVCHSLLAIIKGLCRPILTGVRPLSQDLMWRYGLDQLRHYGWEQLACRLVSTHGFFFVIMPPLATAGAGWPVPLQAGEKLNHDGRDAGVVPVLMTQRMEKNMNQEPSELERNSTMMALRAHQRGGPEQLVYEEAPRPIPGPGEVLIAVRAAAITLAELTWPETWTAEGVDRTPVIPSHEFAGVVAEVGANVQEFVAGDSVFGLVPFDRDGAAAEFLTVPAACVVKKEPLVPDVTAAAAALPALTAWEALIDQADLRPGQRILIRGGTGAVGSFLTQFAKAMGAEVTATVSSASAVKRTRDLGADHVLIAGHSLGMPKVSGFDVVVDGVGADVPEWMYAAPRPGGHLIVLQEPPRQDLAAKYGVTATFFVVRTRGDRLQQLAAMIANNEVKVAVGLMFPLASGRAAYEAKPSGKTVLIVG